MKPNFLFILDTPLHILSTKMHQPWLQWTRKIKTIFFSEKRSNLAGIVEHDVLTRELEQHGIVEELVDGDVLGETLPPPVMKNVTLFMLT